MKNFTQKFIGLLVFVFTINNAFAQCQDGNDWDLHLEDSYGDGWNGATLSISHCDGTILESDISLSSGNHIVIDVCLPISDGYVIDVGGGAYDEEISWVLFDENGDTEMFGGAGGAVSNCDYGSGDDSGDSGDGSCIYWEELANNLQSELDNVVPEDGVSQADVDAAYEQAFTNGVASVEVPECEEVATQNMPLDLPQGWSMFGYTCLESLDVVEAFSGTSNNIEIVKDELGLAYLPAWGFSAFENLEFGEGYQIKMIEEVTGFQFCEAIVPEDGIGQADVDAAFDDGAASITPEDGIGQADVDAAFDAGAASVECDPNAGYDAGYSDGASSVDITSDNADVADTAFDQGYSSGSYDGYNYGLVDGAASVTPEDGIGQADVDAAFDDGWNEGVASVTPEDGISQADVDAAVAEVEANFAASLSVGDFYQGGIVFQINEDGTGLVSAQEDLEGTYEWGCYGVSVDGADSEFIGSGLQNTIDIISQGCTTENGSTIAAQAALDAEITGYSDWYLPSKDELTEMYNTIGNGGPEGNIGGFENSFYWSSSENDYYNIGALSVNFLDGYSDSYYKSNSHRVRVIRAF